MVQQIRDVLIVGAGAMGREIGLQCARYGVRTVLYDVSPQVLEQAALQGIATCADLGAAEEADLVIECVPENLELKRRVFEAVSEHVRPETILATNTSSLLPSQLAASCRYPQKLAALHFHLPVATSNAS